MKKTPKKGESKPTLKAAHQQPSSSPIENKRKSPWLQAYQYKKGQSGNPAGRTPGKSLREYAKEMLGSMTEEERQAFLEGIDKSTIWEMAEGKAMSAQEITGKDGGPIQIEGLEISIRKK